MPDQADCSKNERVALSRLGVTDSSEEGGGRDLSLTRGDDHWRRCRGDSRSAWRADRTRRLWRLPPQYRSRSVPFEQRVSCLYPPSVHSHLQQLLRAFCLSSRVCPQPAASAESSGAQRPDCTVHPWPNRGASLGGSWPVL